MRTDSNSIIQIQIPLTAETDINIAKLARGEGIPALCVKLFRVADFFLLKELQKSIMTGLRLHLDTHFAIPDNGDVSSARARELDVSQMFDSIREVYKDDSTKILRDMLLTFLWKRSDRLFKLPEVPGLLEKIPELGKDLMKMYISDDAGINMNDANKHRKGIRILQAIQEPDLVYKASDQEASAQGRAKVQCFLRHKPKHPSNFEALNADTGAAIKELAWITPPWDQIFQLICNEASNIVCTHYDPVNPVDLDTKKLWLRFETPADARYYIVCQGMFSRDGLQTRQTKDYLEKQMSRMHNDLSRATSS